MKLNGGIEKFGIPDLISPAESTIISLLLKFLQYNQLTSKVEWLVTVDIKEISHYATDNNSKRVSARREKPQKSIDVRIVKAASTLQFLLQISHILEN